MAGYRPARGGVETMEGFYKRRQREVAHFGEEAAAARDAYGQAIRAGEDLNLPTTGDVMRYGADVLRGKSTQPKSQVGLNQGELLFDAGSLLYGGAEAKGFTGLAKAAEASGAEKYLARGIEPGLADYFATPYMGGGHHYWPRRTNLPSWLGGGPLPKVISDSPFFLLKPEGIETGAMMERHYKVDPHYHGGKIPAEFGGGSWSGDALGWEKYDKLGRLWYGAPTSLNAVAGGGVVGTGAVVDQLDGDGRR